MLVRTICLHFKRTALSAHQIESFRFDFRQVVSHHARAAEGMHAGDFFQPIGNFSVIGLVKSLYHVTAVHDDHFMGNPFQRMLDVLLQHALKVTSVFPLEMDFAIAYNNRFFHFITCFLLFWPVC